jgi:hypothetical protein
MFFSGFLVGDKKEESGIFISPSLQEGGIFPKLYTFI